MNKPVFLTSILAGLIIIFAAKSYFIGLAIMLGGTIMSVILFNASNSDFGSSDDEEDEAIKHEETLHYLRKHDTD